MPRLRRNEWNFSAVAAATITELLRNDPEFVGSTMGRAEPELTELNGARRLDLVIFSRENEALPLVTGELKVPWGPEGERHTRLHSLKEHMAKPHVREHYISSLGI